MGASLCHAKELAVLAQAARRGVGVLLQEGISPMVKHSSMMVFVLWGKMPL
jgi:hypothetical protein